MFTRSHFGFAVFGTVAAGIPAISFADTIPQPLPYSQNWATGPAIDNVWSDVPGVTGYLGDFFPGSATSVNADPRTFTGDDDISSVSLSVNVQPTTQTPTAATGGNVHYFSAGSAGLNSNATVSFQGSASGDAPFILIHVNTTGFNNISVAYNLRELDADNAPQRVALLYRVGLTGGFTNVPAAYVADAANGSALVTPVNVVLPAAADNKPDVSLRISTTNATGTDSMIGIDDIAVSGTALVAAASDWEYFL